MVWRRLAYFGETITHSALLGVALAMLFDFGLAIGIFVTASVVVLIMFYLERRDTLPTDTLLGLMTHGGLALGLVILSFFPNMQIDLHALLFGDILAVSRADLVLTWAGRAVALGVLLWVWRPLLVATVSPDLAAVAKLKLDRAQLIFGILVAAIIAVAVKIVGGVTDCCITGNTGCHYAVFRIESGEHGSRCFGIGNGRCCRGAVCFGKA